MKRFLSVLLILISFSTFGQRAQRVYVDGNELVIADSLGNNPSRYDYQKTRVTDKGYFVFLTINSFVYASYLPNQFLNRLGVPYATGSSATASVAAFKLAAIGGGGTGGSGATLYSQLPDAPTKLSQFANDLNLQTALQVSDLVNAAIAGKIDKDGSKVLTDNNYSSVEKLKLLGVQSGATVNSTDAQLRDRSTHTGPLSYTVISDFVAAVRSQFSVSGAGIAYDAALGRFTFTGGSGGTTATTNAADLTSGKLDDARLSTNVLLSTLTYTDPAWLLKLSAAKIVGLSTVATTGSYSDLTNRPTLFSGSYADLTNKPVLFSGSYADLANKPVLFSGNYPDLTNKPTIPTDLNAFTNGPGYLLPGAITGKLNVTDSTVFVRKAVGKGLSTNDFTAALLAKLNGVQTGATANSTDAFLLARANHTGTIPASVIADFVAAVRASFPTSGSGYTYNQSTGLFTITGGSGGGTTYTAGTGIDITNGVISYVGAAPGAASNWTVSSLQAAMDAATSTGPTSAVIIVNNEVVVGGTSLQARSNVELKSTNGKGWIHATQNQPGLEFHGTVANATFTDLIFTNTLVTAAGAPPSTHAGCVESYYDCTADNIRFVRSKFKVRDANSNACSFAPYSPSARGGAGTGNPFRGLYFIDCVADSIGRGFGEVTTHVQEDGKRNILFQDLYVIGGTYSNFGYLNSENPKWGAGFSISGPSWNTNYTDVKFKNVTYAAIEGVAARDMTVKNLTTESTNGNLFASVALSATFDLGIRCQDVVIDNANGSATGRFVSAQDVDRLTIKGGKAFTNTRNSFDRVANLKLKTVRWNVTRGTQWNVSNNEGGNVAYIKDCPDLEITDSDFTLTNGSETNYSALQTAGTTTGTIDGGSVNRPSGANDDALVTRDTPGVSVNNVAGAPNKASSTKVVTGLVNLTYRQSNVSTTAGTNLTLTHSFGTNTAIDRIIGYESGSRVSVDIPFDVSSVTDTQVTIVPAASTTYSSIVVLGQKLQ